MNKKEFINLLVEYGKKAEIFQGRFVKLLSHSDEYWIYVRPAVDCLEPSIDLTKNGKVIYENYTGFSSVEAIEYTYEEFITKYHLK